MNNMNFFKSMKGLITVLAIAAIVLYFFTDWYRLGCLPLTPGDYILSLTLIVVLYYTYFNYLVSIAPLRPMFTISITAVSREFNSHTKRYEPAGIITQMRCINPTPARVKLLIEVADKSSQWHKILKGDYSGKKWLQFAPLQELTGGFGFEELCNTNAFSGNEIQKKEQAVQLIEAKGLHFRLSCWVKSTEYPTSETQILDGQEYRLFRSGGDSFLCVYYF